MKNRRNQRKSIKINGNKWKWIKIDKENKGNGTRPTPKCIKILWPGFILFVLFVYFYLFLFIPIDFYWFLLIFLISSIFTYFSYFYYFARGCQKKIGPSLPKQVRFKNANRTRKLENRTVSFFLVNEFRIDLSIPVIKIFTILWRKKSYFFGFS